MSAAPAPLPIAAGDSAPNPPAQPVAPQAKATGPRQPKLRLACDSCAAARVKCSKEHPRCSRCINGGHDCVYGISRKHGRPQQKKKQDAGDPLTASKTQNDKQPEQQQHQHQHLQNFPGGQADFAGQDMGFDDFLPDLDTSFAQGWFPNMDMLSSMSSTNGLVAPQDLMFGSTMPSFPVHGSISSASQDASSGSTSRSSPPEGPSRKGHRHQYSGSSLPNDLFDLHLQDPITQHIFNASQTTMDSSGTMPATQPLMPLSRDSSNSSSGGGGTDSHDCYAIANFTLAMLHCEHDHQHQHQFEPASAVSTGSSTPQPTVPALDNILSNNKAAISNVLECLKCPCAADPHMAMLYASITSKVLRWYQIAAGVPLAFSNPTSEMLALSSASSMGDIAGSQSWGNNLYVMDSPVLHEHVKVGNFSPDVEDQEPMRRVLLLGELQKAGQLIDALSSMHNGANLSNPGDGVDGSASNLYTTLGSWLKSELSRTLKEVRRGNNSIRP